MTTSATSSAGAWTIPVLHQGEQFALVLSMLFLPLGFLALAQVTRWYTPRLTAVATPLVLWGMWGFANVIALGYAAGSVGPGAIGVDASVQLNEAFLEHPGVLAFGLFPHLIGSFLGVLLLSIACWRSGVFPRVPLVLLVAFLIWDFTLPSAGPLEPHLLLMVALVWLGVHLIRMPQQIWLGGKRLSGKGARLGTLSRCSISLAVTRSAPLLAWSLAGIAALRVSSRP